MRRITMKFHHGSNPPNSTPSSARSSHAEASRLWRLLTPACCALLSLLSWACAARDDSIGEPIRIDSAGVALVLSGDVDRRLPSTFESILDLAAADNGRTPFFRVHSTSIGVDSLGNIYVLDAGNYRISIFDRAGRDLRSFGRRGEGPGELGFPSDMAVSPAGEVAVYDFARRAFVFFDAAGSFAATFPLPGPLQRKAVILDDRRIVAAVTQPADVPDSTDYILLALGRDLTEIALIRQASQPRMQQFSCTSRASPPYFAPRVVWAAGGDRIVLSDDATYSIRVVDGDSPAAVWRRDLPVIQSTVELAAWEVADGDGLRVRGCVVPAEEAAIKFGYAALAPIVSSLAVTSDGGVWLMRRTDVPGELPIDVLDYTGAYVGTLPSGSPFPVVFRGPDEFVVVETDDLDVPHVVVYRIHRGS